MRLRLWWFLALATSGCQSPTEVRLQITSDVACPGAATTGEPTLNETAIVVDRLDAIDRDELPPNATTPNCSQDAAVANVGDLAIVPGEEDAIGVRVHFGIDDTSALACLSGCNENCIEVSRRVSFVPHQSLVLPLRAQRDCIGVCCPNGKTCFEGLCLDDDVALCTTPPCEPTPVAPGELVWARSFGSEVNVTELWSEGARLWVHGHFLGGLEVDDVALASSQGTDVFRLELQTGSGRVVAHDLCSGPDVESLGGKQEYLLGRSAGAVTCGGSTTQIAGAFGLHASAPPSLVEAAGQSVLDEAATSRVCNANSCEQWVLGIARTTGNVVVGGIDVAVDNPSVVLARWSESMAGVNALVGVTTAPKTSPANGLLSDLFLMGRTGAFQARGVFTWAPDGAAIAFGEQDTRSIVVLRMNADGSLDRVERLFDDAGGSDFELHDMKRGPGTTTLVSLRHTTGLRVTTNGAEQMLAPNATGDAYSLLDLGTDEERRIELVETRSFLVTETAPLGAEATDGYCFVETDGELRTVHCRRNGQSWSLPLPGATTADIMASADGELLFVAGTFAGNLLTLRSSELRAGFVLALKI